MKRECFTSLKHSCVCAEFFTEDSFKQNFMVRSLLVTILSFKPRWLPVKKDAVVMICIFTVAYCKPTIGQTNDEKQGNNALRTTGELLCHFPSKTNDSLMQKRSNVQDDNNVIKQSFSSTPSMKLQGCFRNNFIKSSAVFILSTFLLFFSALKKEFCIHFLLNVLFNILRL